LSKVSLGYSTNCYSGDSIKELLDNLRCETAKIISIRGSNKPSLGLSLRIGIEQATELSSHPELVEELRDTLDAVGVRVLGANAFPISAPVNGVYKDNIYRPDWRSQQRCDTTIQIAKAICELVPVGQQAVLSTMTGTYRPWFNNIPELKCAEKESAEMLIKCARELEKVSEESGRDLVLALEPEPFTTAETIEETLKYFNDDLAEGGEVVRRRIGINVDLCHYAVMHEDALDAIRRFRASEIRVAGVHVSSALSVPDPVGDIEALRSFDENVYLHQVFARSAENEELCSWPDLGQFLGLGSDKISEFKDARIHFHVPVFAKTIGGLATTSELTWDVVRQSVSEELAELFIVETYTWPQLLESDSQELDLAAGIAREIALIEELLGITDQ
jgi:sugar phosphate isomerase/epimerase